jgi:hypothetical protein
MRAVVNSVSAAVPAPAHQMLGEMKCSFSQFYTQAVSQWSIDLGRLDVRTLSATIGPLVALVSAAI